MFSFSKKDFISEVNSKAFPFVAETFNSGDIDEINSRL